MTMSIPEEIDSLISSIEQLVSDDDQEALSTIGVQLQALVRADHDADPPTLAYRLEALAYIHYSLGDIEHAIEYLCVDLRLRDEFDTDWQNTLDLVTRLRKLY